MLRIWKLLPHWENLHFSFFPEGVLLDIEFAADSSFPHSTQDLKNALILPGFHGFIWESHCHLNFLLQSMWYYSLAAFKIFSLSLVFRSFILMCFGQKFLFVCFLWSLLSFLNLSFFCQIWKVSAICLWMLFQPQTPPYHLLGLHI